jgi:hypothetical protein
MRLKLTDGIMMPIGVAIQADEVKGSRKSEAANRDCLMHGQA